ncbi:MAG: efflux RND transporter periplasmic adaptor subunit [Bacteroides sp.]
MKSKIVLFAFCLSLAGCGQKGQMGMGGVEEYAVMTLQTANSDLKSTYPAIIKGKQDIEIRPQVAGFITKVCVDEGSVVHKGQTLFIIDQVQYQAAVHSAEASVQVAKSSVATQQLTVNNKRELLKKEIISQYDMDMALNQLASQKALLAQANAQLTNARQNLSYTLVKSPSSGVVGTIPFRVGSLVSSSTPTPLTTVSDISEMYVYFSMTEKQLLGMTREGGTIKEILAKMPLVQLQLIDGTTYEENGKIETLSGVIEQSTGAVSMRATFPNKRNILRSGGTGSILIPYTELNALIIPQKATYEIQDKKFVYLVTDSATTKTTEISVFPINNGQNFVVTSGLKAGDKIVIEGVGTSVKDGMKIQPKETK